MQDTADTGGSHFGELVLVTKLVGGAIARGGLLPRSLALDRPRPTASGASAQTPQAEAAAWPHLSAYRLPKD